jgi:hypothetical protein
MATIFKPFVDAVNAATTTEAKKEAFNKLATAFEKHSGSLKENAALFGWLAKAVPYFRAYGVHQKSLRRQAEISTIKERKATLASWFDYLTSPFASLARHLGSAMGDETMDPSRRGALADAQYATFDWSRKLRKFLRATGLHVLTLAGQGLDAAVLTLIVRAFITTELEGMAGFMSDVAAMAAATALGRGAFYDAVALLGPQLATVAAETLGGRPVDESPEAWFARQGSYVSRLVAASRYHLYGGAFMPFFISDATLQGIFNHQTPYKYSSYLLRNVASLGAILAVESAAHGVNYMAGNWFTKRKQELDDTLRLASAKSATAAFAWRVSTRTPLRMMLFAGFQALIQDGYNVNLASIGAALVGTLPPYWISAKRHYELITSIVVTLPRLPMAAGNWTLSLLSTMGAFMQTVPGNSYAMFAETAQQLLELAAKTDPALVQALALVVGGVSISWGTVKLIAKLRGS